MKENENQIHEDLKKKLESSKSSTKDVTVSSTSNKKHFFIDEEITHASLHKHSKERLKHERSIFPKGIDSIKESHIEEVENETCEQQVIKFDRVGLFTTPKEMVVKSTGITLHPKGLVNSRNDCFLNATLQVLLSIKPFVDHYYAYKGQKLFSLALKEFITSYHTNKYANPDILIVQLKSRMHFMDGNEQDAHEFLVSLLDQLYKEQGGTDSVITKQDELEEIQHTNFIAHTFYGMQRNIIKCTKCSKQNEGYQETSILSCELEANVEKTLTEYTKSEKISYDCPVCGSVKGIKRFDIVNHSRIMIIHLKRFNYNGRKNYTKIDVCESFEFFGSHYKLLGAIVHIGDCDSGHYYSEAIRNGKWIRFDDMDTREIEENKNDLRDAYILFYEKRNK